MISLINHHLWKGRNEVVIIYPERYIVHGIINHQTSLGGTTLWLFGTPPWVLQFLDEILEIDRNPKNDPQMDMFSEKCVEIVDSCRTYCTIYDLSTLY